jgi:hypothetical protein
MPGSGIITIFTVGDTISGAGNWGGIGSGSRSCTIVPTLITGITVIKLRICVLAGIPIRVTTEAVSLA